MSEHRAVLLKRCLLAFWGAYLSLVCITNVFDGLKARGVLGKAHVFASGNYRLMVETTRKYEPPKWLNEGLFLGVICWEGVGAALFWLAAWSFRGRGREGSASAFAAFAVGLALWAAFVLADEIFIAYPIEAVHWRLFTAQLATLLAVELLPDGG